MVKRRCLQLNQMKKRRNQGSAMMVAIVVSMVVLAFCLSLLLVSYALFSSSVRKVTQNQCRELAKSVSLELEQELTGAGYAAYQDQKAALDAGEDTFWQYIRYNLCQTNWPYYAGEDESGHDEKAAKRYFKLNINGGDTSKYTAMADDISVCVYWENDGSYTSSKDGLVLCVDVTCTKGKQSASMTSRYELTCADYEDIEADVTDTGTLAVNPSGNMVVSAEHWIWSFLERE